MIIQNIDPKTLANELCWQPREADKENIAAIIFALQSTGEDVIDFLSNNDKC